MMLRTNRSVLICVSSSNAAKVTCAAPQLVTNLDCLPRSPPRYTACCSITSTQHAFN